MPDSIADMSLFGFGSMFTPLFRAYPPFHEKWEKLREEWEGEPPLYLTMSHLARHLIRDLEVGNTHYFDAVFSVVERWSTSEDRDVREAVTVGLLEDLQNGHLHSSTRPEDFHEWLRPETAERWFKVRDFWEKGC